MFNILFKIKLKTLFIRIHIKENKVKFKQLMEIAIKQSIIYKYKLKFFNKSSNKVQPFDYKTFYNEHTGKFNKKSQSYRQDHV